MFKKSISMNDSTCSSGIRYTPKTLDDSKMTIELPVTHHFSPKNDSRNYIKAPASYLMNDYHENIVNDSVDGGSYEFAEAVRCESDRILYICNSGRYCLQRECGCLEIGDSSDLGPIRKEYLKELNCKICAKKPFLYVKPINTQNRMRHNNLSYEKNARIDESGINRPSSTKNAHKYYNEDDHINFTDVNRHYSIKYTHAYYNEDASSNFKDVDGQYGIQNERKYHNEDASSNFKDVDGQYGKQNERKYYNEGFFRSYGDVDRQYGIEDERKCYNEGPFTSYYEDNGQYNVKHLRNHYNEDGTSNLLGIDRLYSIEHEQKYYNEDPFISFEEGDNQYVIEDERKYYNDGPFRSSLEVGSQYGIKHLQTQYKEGSYRNYRGVERHHRIENKREDYYKDAYRRLTGFDNQYQIEHENYNETAFKRHRDVYRRNAKQPSYNYYNKTAYKDLENKDDVDDIVIYDNYVDEIENTNYLRILDTQKTTAFNNDTMLESLKNNSSRFRTNDDYLNETLTFGEMQFVEMHNNTPNKNNLAYGVTNREEEEDSDYMQNIDSRRKNHYMDYKTNYEFLTINIDNQDENGHAGERGHPFYIENASFFEYIPENSDIIPDNPPRGLYWRLCNCTITDLATPNNLELLKFLNNFAKIIIGISICFGIIFEIIFYLIKGELWLKRQFGLFIILILVLFLYIIYNRLLKKRLDSLLGSKLYREIIIFIIHVSFFYFFLLFDVYFVYSIYLDFYSLS